MRRACRRRVRPFPKRSLILALRVGKLRQESPRVGGPGVVLSPLRTAHQQKVEGFKEIRNFHPVRNSEISDCRDLL